MLVDPAEVFHSPRIDGMDETKACRFMSQLWQLCLNKLMRHRGTCISFNSMFPDGHEKYRFSISFRFA